MRISTTGLLACAALAIAASPADVGNCLNLVTRPGADAALTNVCTDWLNVMYCIDGGQATPACTDKPKDVVTLMTGDLRLLVTAIELSRATMRNIRQNLFWAFAYNVILVPVAMGALYPITGTLLDPIFAAAAMALSSVTVVSNALRLRRFQPQNRPRPAPTLVASYEGVPS